MNAISAYSTWKSQKPGGASISAMIFSSCFSEIHRLRAYLVSNLGLQRLIPKAVIRICHLSLLNPAIHSRIFEKEAISQVNAGFEVCIIGQDTALIPYNSKGVRIVPLPLVSGFSVGRIFQQIRILVLVLKENPDFFVFHTPELLPIAFLLSIFKPKSRRVYDVHEDYVANNKFGGFKSGWRRYVVSSLASILNRWMVRNSHGVIFAEQCYKLPAGIQRPSIYAENKFNPSGEVKLRLPYKSSIPVLLFSGTLSPVWGLDKSLQLWKKLNETIPVKLLVAGHTSDKKVIKEMLAFVRESGLSEYFELLGGTEYVPHVEIISRLEKSTLVLALYETRENIICKIPTKFYEAIYHKIPVLFSKTNHWETLNERWDFGMAVSDTLKTEELEKIISIILNGGQGFYNKPILPEEYLWEGEGKKLNDFFLQLKT